MKSHFSAPVDPNAAWGSPSLGPLFCIGGTVFPNSVPAFARKAQVFKMAARDIIRESFLSPTARASQLDAHSTP